MTRALPWLALSLILLGEAAMAQVRPSLNLYGVPGGIEMPSGEQMPDGFLSLDKSFVGPLRRTTITFQLTPRLSGSFRYLGYENWNDAFCPPDCTGVNKYETYYDRNFDVSYQLFTEGRLRPAVSIGLVDFAGTGINAAEYVAATKNFGRLKVTAGLGFGRLASLGSIGSLGTRPAIDFGKGGEPNWNTWFRGDMAPFAGLEYQFNDKWSAKVEYSSDAYTVEAVERGLFDRKSPLNFGVQYRPNKTFTLGAYHLYGDIVGVNISLAINPGQRPMGGVAGVGPLPVLQRPPRSDGQAWVTGWTEAPGVNETYVTALQTYLDLDTGLRVEGLEITGDRVQVRYVNTRYDAPSQAMGRIARALTHVMPASVEVFELVPVENGMAATKLVLYRSNLEKFEGTLGASDALLVRSHIREAGPQPEGMVALPEAYPRLRWSLTPDGKIRTFDPRSPLEFQFGYRLAARYEPAPGIVVSGAIVDGLTSGLSRNADDLEVSPLPHVRSESAEYMVETDPVMERLTAAYYTRLGPDLYGRATAGYLERMFGGVSTEVLYRPQGRRWALGAEANYVAQRDRNGRFGFSDYDYRVATGHVSGYLDLGGGYNLQLDVGRYLAGDAGASLTLMRDFANGWRIGAYATKTNVSAEEFGEGSFDKGIVFHIPINWFVGKPTRTDRRITLQPIERDGGARLRVEGRLYETLRDYDSERMTADWGRFWK